MTVIDKNNLWDSVLTELQLSLSNANFQTWFKGKTSMLSIDKGAVEIGCLSEYNKVWIEERYLGKLKEIVDRLTGISNNLVLTVTAENLPRPAKTKLVDGIATVPLFEEDQPQIRDLLDSANLNQKYSFSNFIVGNTNRLAYAVAKAVVDEPFDRYNPLLIYGGVGVGKTHLLQAIARAALLKRADSRVLYCSSESFTNDMVEAIQKRQTTSFRNKYRRAEFLLIDDIQFIAGRESTQEEFFHTFNTLYGQGKQIILSCDRAPEELADLQERLKNRFLGGMIAKIDPPDIELREAVLLSKIKSTGMKVDFSVIRTLAKNLGPSIRELEGALLRLAAISRLTSQRIDHTLVEKVVDLRNDAKDPLSSVVQTVADYFSIEVADLKGHKRSKDRVFPRQIAMYLIREVSDLSFKAIAKYFGGKDHTTVMYSISKVEKAVKNSKEAADLVEEIRMRALNGG